VLTFGAALGAADFAGALPPMNVWCLLAVKKSSQIFVCQSTAEVLLFCCCFCCEALLGLCGRAATGLGVEGAETGLEDALLPAGFLPPGTRLGATGAQLANLVSGYKKEMLNTRSVLFLEPLG